MAWMQSDLDAIDKALASGELTVHFADRSVTYRSLDELLRIRALISDALQNQAGTTPERFSLAKSSKG